MSSIDSVLRAAGKAVQAHIALKQATEDEASERALKVKQKLLFEAMERLSSEIQRLPQQLPANPSALFDWQGFFGTAREVIDLVKSAKAGDKDVIGKAQRIIDAEFSGTRDRRR